MARIVIGQGWYLITYGLGIYILNLFLAFLTPKVDPVTLQSEDDDDAGLPTSNQEEFRPFIRRLPEFKFWYSMTKVSVDSGVGCSRCSFERTGLMIVF